MDKFTNLSDKDGHIIKNIIVNDAPGVFVIIKQMTQ